MNEPKRQPPKLAIQMFSAFVPSRVREEMLGDLLEKFQEVQSPMWFWQEVIAAILLSLVGLLRSRLTGIAFAMVGAASEQLWFRSKWWKTVWQSSMFESFYGWVVSSPFPLGVIYGFCLQAALSTLYILVLLCLFWSFKKLWRWTNIRNTVLLCMPLLAVGLLIDASLPAPYDSLLHALPTFGALMIAIFISDSATDHGSVTA